MDNNRSSTLIGVFRDRPQAERAVRELRQAGFRGGQIGLATGPPPDSADVVPGRDSVTRGKAGATASKGVGRLLRGAVGKRQVKKASRALSGEIEGATVKDGAVTGGVAGGVVAGLLGAATVVTGLIPGVGSVVAGGLMAGVLGSTVAGVAAGGLVGALVGAGVAEREAQFYQQEWAAGHSLVAVRVRSRSREAAAILRRCGAYDARTPRCRD